MKETGLRIYAIGNSVVEQRHAMLPVVGTSRALVVSPDRGANHTTKISYRFGGSPVVLYGNPCKNPFVFVKISYAVCKSDLFLAVDHVLSQPKRLSKAST